MSGFISAGLGLDPAVFAALCAIVLGAGAVRGLTGFGFAILAVPLMGLVIPPTQAVLLAIVLQMLIGPFGVSKAIGHIDTRIVAGVAAGAMVGTPLGLLILSGTSPDVARLLIAAIAVGCFGIFLVKRAPLPSRALSHVAATGVAAGLLNGFAAMPGPPVILYFVRSGVTPMAARGSMILVFFAAATAGTMTAWLRGLLDGPLVLLAAAVFPLMLLGNHVGSRFFGVIPERLWRTAVVILLIASALGALVKLWRG